MSIIDRLSGEQLPKLPVHQFWASMCEFADAAITEQDIKDAFGIIDGDDLTEWEWLRNKYIASIDKPMFLMRVHILFMLAEKKMYNYHVKNVIQARINSLQ